MRSVVIPLHQQPCFMEAITLMHASYDRAYVKIGYLNKNTISKNAEECRWTLKGRRHLSAIRFMEYPWMGERFKIGWVSTPWKWCMKPPLHHALCHQFLYDALSAWITNEQDAAVLEHYVSSGALGIEFQRSESAELWWTSMHMRCELYQGVSFLEEGLAMYEHTQEEGILVW